MIDRLYGAIRAIIRGEIAAQGRLGVYEYNVAEVNGFPPAEVLVSAMPTDPTLGLPNITRASMRASIIGGTAVPNVGAKIHLAFLNGDLSKPVWVGGDQNVKFCFLDPSNPAPLLRGVARVGDAVVGGLITTGSTKVFA